jgi:hypothetical protein
MARHRGGDLPRRRKAARPGRAGGPHVGEGRPTVDLGAASAYQPPSLLVIVIPTTHAPSKHARDNLEYASSGTE